MEITKKKKKKLTNEVNPSHKEMLHEQIVNINSENVNTTN